MRIVKIFFCVLIILIFFGSINAIAYESIQITDKVTVIEAKASFENISAGEETVLIELTKSSNGICISQKLLCIDEEGCLSFENQRGETNRLVRSDSTPIKFAEELNISVLYDDCSGLARYYVDQKAAYFVLSDFSLEKAVPVKNEFFSISSESDSFKISNALENVTVRNDDGNGTAQIIALQEHFCDSRIRLIAGVDTLWFKSVGFELDVYRNGELYEETFISSDIVYTEVLAEDIPINATEFGFDYFSALEIYDIYVGDYDYYIIVRPYAEMDGSKIFGDPVGIIVEGEKLSFDENFKSQKLTDNIIAPLSLNCNKEIYATISSPEESLVDVFVDGVKTESIKIEQGRNNVLLAIVSEGNHEIRLDCNGNNYVKVISVQYFASSCNHIINSSSAWAVKNGYYTAVCSLCNNEVAFNESQTPAFMLTFDKDVAAEASQYSGFKVVSPSGFSIGNDLDGDKALVAGEKNFYVDVEQSTLAAMPYYVISFDLTVTKQGLADSNISLLTLISNYRDGVKVSGQKVDRAYFFKYNTNKKAISSINADVYENLLNDTNSISIVLNKQYKISIVVDTVNCIARVFVDGKYIGISEKTPVDVTGNNKVYPSFSFNGGGACYPIYDNFKIVEIK